MPRKPKSLLARFLVWRYRYLSHRQFLFFLAVVVGFASGIGAALLKKLTHMVSFFVEEGSFQKYHIYLYFGFPLIGLMLVVLIKKYIIRKKFGEGIPMALQSLARRNGTMDKRIIFSSLLGAPVTIGFGGSVGLEGPAVGNGAAIGAQIASFFHIDKKSRKLLLVCAATGSVAAIYKAPITAIVFALEIFSLDLTVNSLMPLLLASVSATVTGTLFIGTSYLVPFYAIERFHFENIPYYCLLGFFTALISIYFSELFFCVEKLFKSLKNHYKKALVSGVILGILILLIPPLYGEGFNFINDLIDMNDQRAFKNFLFTDYLGKEGLLLLLMMGLLLFKPLATAITIHGGGVGGIFASTLFIGVTAGAFFEKFFKFLGVGLPVSNFTLVGMAGLMAGILQAPLTAIFLIAELTGGYQLFLPLMITSGLSFSITRYFMPHSIYTRELAQKGELITHNKDQLVLLSLSTEKLIEKNFVPLRVSENMKALISAISLSQRNLFPVVDERGELKGIITLDDVRSIMFKSSLYEKISVKELMSKPPEILFIGESIASIMNKFERSNAWNLPVIEQGKYVGFISKSKLLSVYRRKLMEVSL